MTCTNAGSSAKRTETGVDRRRSLVVRLMSEDFRLCWEIEEGYKLIRETFALPWIAKKQTAQLKKTDLKIDLHHKL